MNYRLEMFRPTSATIHLGHLLHNLERLRDFAGTAVFFCPVIKANAYGHGDIDVAKVLEANGVRSLGVGLVEEGLLLRQMGMKSQILVFGMFDTHSAEEMLRWKLTPVISSWAQLEILYKMVTEKLDVHVKFNTGMQRLGFEVDEAEKVFQKLSQNSFLHVQGLMTHLHSAEDADSGEGTSIIQLQKFHQTEKIFEKYHPFTHTLNSAGLLNFYDQRLKGKMKLGEVNLRQGVRPGLALYGYSPLKSTYNLKPVMSLRSAVVACHALKKGETVSYGATWKAPGPSVVGAVPIGYADGYHRSLSNKGFVLFEGVRTAVIGNVCMDYIMIDLTEIAKSRGKDSLVGKPVTLFGYDQFGNCLSAKDLASEAGTVTWEVLTSISERVPRVMENPQ